METAIRIHHIWENGELVRSYYETPTPNHEYFGRVDVYPTADSHVVNTTDFFDTTDDDTNETDTIIEDTPPDDASTSSETTTFTPVCRNSAASRMLDSLASTRALEVWRGVADIKQCPYNESGSF